MKLPARIAACAALLLAGCSNVDIDWDGITFRDPPPPEKTRFLSGFEGDASVGYGEGWTVSSPTRVDRDGLYLSGRYEFDPRKDATESGRQARLDTNIPRGLDRSFTVFLKFRPDAVTGPHAHLFTLGPASRMVTLGFEPDGALVLDLNNHAISRRLDGGAPAAPGKWSVIALVFDWTTSRMTVIRDGRVTDRIAPPAGFSLSPSRHTGGAFGLGVYEDARSDARSISFQDNSLGTAFRGHIRTLDIRAEALPEAEATARCAEIATAR